MPVGSVGSETMSAETRQAGMPSKYDRLIAAAKAVPPVPTIVVHPCDETSLRGVLDSAAAGIIRPVLVGPEAKIRSAASRFGLDISGFEIVDAAHSEEAAAKGVELIHAAKGEMLMKGSLHTDELMRSVTAKVGGLRTDRRISHVFVMDVPAYAETLFVTDAAVAETGEMEIELGPVEYLREGADRSLFAPDVRINYGFTSGWEASLEGDVSRGLTTGTPVVSLVESEALLKGEEHYATENPAWWTVP